jgi:hypothetical protein
MSKTLWVRLIVCALLCLGLSSAYAKGGGSFDDAFDKIAKQLEAAQKRQKGGVSAISAPSAGKVDFEIPLSRGKGNAETDKRCFGITLDCEATITGPSGEYNVQVGTSAGSKHKFVKLVRGKPVAFKLETEGGFSSTTFSIKIESNNPGSNQPVKVALAYSY